MDAETARALTPPLPIAVRRARPADRDAVLGFASATWDGWDYIPDAWDHWLSASDGVLLVATPQRVSPGRDPARDADGAPLDPDLPIAVARIGLLSEREAWLEGIRVDPRVRGRAVATNLQVAELEWVAAHGVDVVRYATGERNEGSHRLGVHHGFRLTGAWRSYGRADDDDDGDDDDDEGGHDAGDAPDPAARSPDALRSAGLLLPRDVGDDEIHRWWSRLEADPTFAAGDRLYERRSWAFQELTYETFAADVRAGVVLAVEDQARPDAWALAIIPTGWLEDDPPYLTAVCGDGAGVLALVRRLRDATGGPPRIRLPDPDPPLLRRREEAFLAAGLAPRDHALHIFQRRLVAEGLPRPEPHDALLLEDPPSRVAAPAGVA